MNRKIYIHYGSDAFSAAKFKKIANKNSRYEQYLITRQAETMEDSVPPFKPFGGLWASPEDTKSGWKDFCEENDLSCSEHFFRFQLKKSARILRIETETDIQDLPDEYFRVFFWFRKTAGIFDFERMRADGIDAVEMIMHQWTREMFPTWDVDSLLIMNPEIIEPI